MPPLQVITMTCDSRSEEHTSELQSQSTISYAVFCLKKKKKKKREKKKKKKIIKKKKKKQNKQHTKTLQQRTKLKGHGLQ